MDTGDIPAWIALFLSIGSLGRQWYIERRSAKASIKSVSLGRLHSMENTLADVRAHGMSYWLQPPSAHETDALMLLHNLRILSRDVSEYRDLLWPSAANDILALKISLTGSRFQEADRPFFASNDAFIRTFMGKTSDITAKLKDSVDAL